MELDKKQLENQKGLATNAFTTCRDAKQWEEAKYYEGIADFLTYLLENNDADFIDADKIQKIADKVYFNF